MAPLRTAGSDCDLDVIVQPGARRAGLVSLHGDRVKVAVSAPPVDGKANDAVLRLFADVTGLAPSRIELVRGASDRRKTLRFHDLPQGNLLSALARGGVQIPTQPQR